MYQKPFQTHDDDNADEASSLVLTVAGGGGGVLAAKKTHGVPTMRAVIVTTCFFLGTLAVIYRGRGSSSHTSSGGISADLLRWYDPSSDFCFADTDNPGKNCWYPNDNFPCGNWKRVTGAGFDNCGPQCTQVEKRLKDDRGNSFLGCVPPLYDPSQHYCFTDEDNDDKYCWFLNDDFPCGNWKGVTGRGFDNCGPACTNVVIYGGCKSVKVTSTHSYNNV